MSTTGQDAQHAARVEMAQRRAEENRRADLEARGLADEYDSWRESLPDTRMSDQEVYETFLNAHAVEDASRSGRVSVATGGEEDILRADIPIPGPDGEEARPDEAGEVSQDGDDDPTALKLVPGMWTPPKESTALNYEPPSTHAMTLTPEWVREAKALYIYSDRPEIKDERSGKTIVEPSDEDIANWARNQISMFNWNVAITMAEATKIMTSGDQKRALNYLNLINMYDHSDGGGREFGMALLGIATDPTTYFGLGVGKLAAMGAARATAKQGLKKAAEFAIIGGTTGLTEGAALAGGFDLTVQNIEQEAGAREDIDKSRVGTATAMGAGLGLTLGGGGGRLVGRYMDNLAIAAKENAERLRGLALEEERRVAENIKPNQLIELLQKSTEEDATKGQQDFAIGVARRYLGGDEPLPRNKDGTVDVDAVAQKLEEMALDAAQARETLSPAGTLAKAVELSNIDDASMHLEVRQGGLEMTATFQHSGPMQDVAEEMGLKVASIPRDEGFFLRVEGTDEQLLDFLYKIHEVPDPLAPGALKGTIFEGLEQPPTPSKRQLEGIDTRGETNMPTRKGSELIFEGLDPDALGRVANEIVQIANDLNIPIREGTTFNNAKDAQAVANEFATRRDGLPRTERGDIDLRKVTDMREFGKRQDVGKNDPLRRNIDSIDRLERAGFKMALGEAGDIAFYADELTEGEHKTLVRIADELGLKYELFVAGNREGDPTTHISLRGPSAQIAEFANKFIEQKPLNLPRAESLELARRIALMDKTEQLEIVPKTTTMPGSLVRTIDGRKWEVMGHTENGWYHLRNKLSGEQINQRRKDFEVIDSHPPPKYGGPMELAPFTESAAKIIAMNEDVVSGKLKEVKITHAEQRAIIDSMAELGVKITEKNLYSHWTPAELAYLRDTYEAQANAMAGYVRHLKSYMENEGKLSDAELAHYNDMHTQFVATRDLFFGTVGNAARQLNILKMRPKDTVYEFSQAVLDSVNLQGGRANTERAILMMADFASPQHHHTGLGKAGNISMLSQSIWGNKKAAWLLNWRYNLMLSSWRTHFFNFTGNSASGMYQHLLVSPLHMSINNIVHASKVALGVLDPKFTPDPAERLTMENWYAELRGHHEGFLDSLRLAREILFGKDIGEGKVWNELGLRYNVINVPETWYGKLGTTPVRALEAGDAFFKNQYYMSKLHELASIKARADEIHGGLDYKTQYHSYINDPDVTMQRTAKEFAAKQTYTNDPNVYGGVLAALARGVASAQNKSWIVNMIIPFVRTPANLLSYSMEMIGANTLLSPSKTWDTIRHGTAYESQEALARLTAAAGLWYAVYEMYENGNITGAGPANWEEQKVWEAAGWQRNSIKAWWTGDKWVAIDRLDPAGQSLATIASIFDFYSMIPQESKTGSEWIGAGLLYTADMIIDDSYLSTATDLITAVSSKEVGRARSVTASIVNSFIVPNIMRDLRRPADAVPRSTTSTDLLVQVKNQFANATPSYSKDLPPQRDWRGDPKNTYGNAYQRAIIPFNIRDPQDSDKSSMALAYARIPISVPNKTIEWPKGQGDAVDLFAMDEGKGWLYDKYVQIMGQERARTVDILTNTSMWEDLVEREQIGPHSIGYGALRDAVSAGSTNGRLKMLGFLIQHSGDNNMFKLADGREIHIKHQVSVGEYAELVKAIKLEGESLPEDKQQYRIDEPVEGPEFFKPQQQERE